MSKNKELRSDFLFVFRKGLKVSDALSEIEAIHGKGVCSKRTIERWFKKFKNFDFNLEDQPRSGRPLSIDLENLKRDIEDKPDQTVREIALNHQSNRSTISEALKRIGKSRKCPKFVPHSLTPAQKSFRIEVCRNLLDLNTTSGFLRDLITGDEKWVMYSNPQTRKQYLGAGEKPRKVVKSRLSREKLLLCVFWDKDGILMADFLKPGETVNSDVYKDQMERLR